MLRMNMTG